VAVTTGRPDLAAYNEAVGMSTAELVTALRDLLGAKLVAYIGGVKETRAVRQWAEGSERLPVATMLSGYGGVSGGADDHMCETRPKSFSVVSGAEPLPRRCIAGSTASGWRYRS